MRCGRGVGGCVVGAVWTRCGRGVDAVWTWCGRGVDAVCVQCGRGEDAVWVRCGPGVGALMRITKTVEITTALTKIDVDGVKVLICS